MNDNPRLEALVETLVRLLAERVAAQVTDLLPTPRAAPDLDATPGWVDKRTASRALGISVATIDRLVREGAPVHLVGSRRRFDLATLRDWLASRGKGPTTSLHQVRRKREADDADIVEL